MYRILSALLMLAVFTCTPAEADSPDTIREEKAVIIEVDGDPEEHKNYLEAHHPAINVVHTYETLFSGLALKGDPWRLDQLRSLPFVKTIHPVVTYETQTTVSDSATADSVLPATLNKTAYTGKGVQVAVIDTGIDYNHPDLKANYAGGYDVVDLDKDPMETLPEEGLPTKHGTHVAGIIAANGDLKGVAPDADIHAYRALGPGGRGTSVNVIAALEQAVEDGADVINLSLGNAVNGPDFPTSVAVNRAFDLGVPVVSANGNAGPDNWTIGSPATAANALSVGASAPPQKTPYLTAPLKDKRLPLLEMDGAKPWRLDKRYDTGILDEEAVQGKIALIERGETPFAELARQAEEAGAVAAVIYNQEPGSFQGTLPETDDPVQIPVASMTKQDGQWLKEHIRSSQFYVNTKYAMTDFTVADFSSRGPVTVNWDLKPNVSAPGTNILSTVPGGYQELQGTSMAAPHVTGAMALLREAHPDWTPEELTGALATTARPIRRDKDELLDPIIQGAGEIRPEKAVNTTTILDEPLLAFGQITHNKETKTQDMTVTNTSGNEQTYRFETPKQQAGLRWDLPLAFTLDEGESATIPIGLTVHANPLDKGIHQGWLRLEQDKKTYQLPYLFINETADYPKAMGFDLTVKPFTRGTYAYQFYLTDPAESVDVALYHPQTLVYDRTLFHTSDVQTGLNKGQLDESELGEPGQYVAVITIRLENGDRESYQTRLNIRDPAE
ncbi:serine protease Vpr [Barrientosiimonas marina]|uniref:S8 family serine peptidase n=1 Tax=Lentibacillus kimchii TaxID=1542911 RepID=A0ABW2UVB3_9BACI